MTRVVGIGSVPMAVPHTRPTAITHHANNPDLLSGDSPWRGELRIPSSAQSLLEVRLGEWGHDMTGFVAHIPHYLAQMDYPQASAALLEQVEIAGRLTIDLSGLRAEAEDREAEIARYLTANEEVAEVVQALERQYDAFERAEESGSSLLARDQPLPTGEELGKEFERFLAGLDGPEAERRREHRLMPRDADELLELLDLERLDDDLFRGAQMPTTRPMVFGGQIAAQSLVAASRTVAEPYVAHSLHSYFLQPGDPSVPTVYDVENLRDGRSFVTRRVIAQQHGRPIYAQTVNFHQAEDGYEHEESMPDVPGPDDPSVRPVSRQAQEELHADQWNVADLRFVGSSGRRARPTTRRTPAGSRCGCGSPHRCRTTSSGTERPSPTSPT